MIHKSWLKDFKNDAPFIIEKDKANLLIKLYTSVTYTNTEINKDQ